MVTFEVERRFEGCASFRQRVALSAIFGVPISIESIRLEDRTAPGLKSYEGDILKLLDELSDGLDLRVDSRTLTDLSLEPGVLIGCEEGELVYKCSPERGLTYYLEFLLMIGPLCKKGIELTLKGVTDHPADIAIDAFRQGVVTAFEKCQIDATVGIEVVRRGMLPEGGGIVKFRCAPIKTVKPFRLTYAGRVKSVKGTVWTCHMSPIFARRCIESTRRILTELLGHVELFADLCNGDKAGKSRGFGITLHAETMKGFCYTADAVCEDLSLKQQQPRQGFDKQNTFGVSQKAEDVKVEQLLESAKLENAEKKGSGKFTREETLAETAVCRLLAEIAEHGVIDSSFQWIPLLFMALSEEHAASRVVLGRLTPSSINLLRLIEKFTGLLFHLESGKSLRHRRSENEADSDDESTSLSSSGLSSSSVKSDPDVKHDVEGGDDEAEDHEGKVAVVEDSKNIKESQLHNCVVVTCVGLGLPNMARKTF